MKVIHLLDLLRNEHYPVLLAAGFFDGMHRGHQRVIQQAMSESQKGADVVWVMTFDTHPMKILHPEASPLLLTSTPHKLHLIKQLGVKGCVIIPFTRALAQLEPESFIENLVQSVSTLHSLFIGENWTFGRDGKGTSDLVKSLARTHGFNVKIIPSVLLEKKPISSTRIRRNIIAGNLEHAASMLGRPVSIWGTVTSGKKIGRSIGVPTANLDTYNETFPPDGVYAVRAFLDAKSYTGIVNLGTRPTTRPHTPPARSLSSAEQGAEKKGSGQEPARILELHLFDIQCDLYGKDIEVFFFKKLRNERRFDSLATLKTQIAKDICQARKWLS